ncbi:hypothetical protein QQ056_00625 [Oscillatoria laete-virens NRMC-F 0139]|nr:hypothetical protein [Oscillatoria laete-virens]MDL5052080.1 hypothetical protein [Oscillatoria laete-virens NRMC-F 0139]
MDASNFDKVYNHLIEEGGKTRVVFINGGPIGGYAGLQNAWSLLDNSLKMSQSSWHPEQDSNKGSVWFNPVINPNETHFWFDFAYEMMEALLTASVSAIQEEVEDYIESFGQDPIEPLASIFNALTSISDPQSFSQVALSNPIILDYITSHAEIPSLVAAVGSDARELAIQYFTENTSESWNVNQQWIEGDYTITEWLDNLEHPEKDKNSVILIPNSQGNFFVEDGLRDLEQQGYSVDFSRIKVIATASETKYASVNGAYPTVEVRATNDPFLELQANENFASKIEHLFNFVMKVFEVGGPSQAMEKHIFPKNYVNHPDLINGFKELIYELHPRGFYFPAGLIVSNPTNDDDWIEGNGLLQGGDRNDILRGGNGNDTLRGDSGFDLLDGNGGDNDIADYQTSEAIKVWADKVAGVDVYKVEDGFNVEGNPTIDTLLNIDIISGSPGNDFMEGSKDTAINDRFLGQDGNDTLYGYGGEDTLEGGWQSDELWGGEGNDSLVGDDIDGWQGEDTLYGEAGNDTLDGGGSTDIVSGGIGDDLLYGGDNNDTLEGGEGNDELNGDGGHPAFTGDDWLKGEAGNDTLRGNLGNDLLEGGTGNDKLYGQEGNDKLYGQEDHDILEGGDNADELYGGTGDDQLYGQAGNDYLEGNEGDDFLDGGCR